MKITPLILCSVLAFACLITAQEQPKRDTTISTAPTAELKGSTVRVTVREFSLDRKLELNIEIRNDTGQMVDKRVVSLSAAQVKTWVNDADPDAWLESHVLSQVKLSKK